MNKKKNLPGRRLSAAVMLFFFFAFLLPALRTQDTLGFVLMVAVPAAVFFGTFILPYFFPTDRLLMSLANFLCATGVLLLYCTSPAYAIQQMIAYALGLGAMIFCIYLVRLVHSWNRWMLLLIPLSLLLLALPVLLDREINGAKNWIVMGGISFQPSEFVKISLVLTVSFYLSRYRPLPWLLFSVMSILLLMLQRDLGTALLYFATILLMYWAFSGNLVFSLAGLFCGAGAAWYGYRTFSHVRLRVAIWMNPRAAADSGGYQIIQGLSAIAEGGLWGVGLGLGSPTAIPVFESDYIFAVLCEQFGIIMGICVLLIYAALIWRGASVARSARYSFHALLAMGSTILIGLQTFVIIGGILNLIPLTGVTLPFISYGGSSLISSLCLVGLIQGVESLNENDSEEELRIRMLERSDA